MTQLRNKFNKVILFCDNTLFYLVGVAGKIWWCWRRIIIISSLKILIRAILIYLNDLPLCVLLLLVDAFKFSFRVISFKRLKLIFIILNLLQSVIWTVDSSRIINLDKFRHLLEQFLLLKILLLIWLWFIKLSLD